MSLVIGLRSFFSRDDAGNYRVVGGLAAQRPQSLDFLLSNHAGVDALFVAGHEPAGMDVDQKRGGLFAGGLIEIEHVALGGAIGDVGEGWLGFGPARLWLARGLLGLREARDERQRRRDATQDRSVNHRSIEHGRHSLKGSSRSGTVESARQTFQLSYVAVGGAVETFLDRMAGLTGWDTGRPPAPRANRVHPVILSFLRQHWKQGAWGNREFAADRAWLSRMPDTVCASNDHARRGLPGPSRFQTANLQF
ncbi:MAG TPA: hypothetical protein VMV69_10535, partial [Pirellulales bacterium]|nr:hypothetical protein [Pirellulales bacterium]